MKMSETRIEQSQAQQQRLSAKLLQSLSIVEMSAERLNDRINREAEENPLLEVELLPTVHFGSRQYRSDPFDDGEDTLYDIRDESSADPSDDLVFQIKDQIHRKRLPLCLRSAALYLAGLLTQDGYLRSEDIISVEEMLADRETVRSAIGVIQSLDPAGIGARSLGECLLLQLSRRKKQNELEIAIVSAWLNELGRKQYGAIAEGLGVTVREVKKAEKTIRELDPTPGLSYDKHEHVPYIEPDVIVSRSESRCTVTLNRDMLPALGIVSYYADLLKETGDEELAAYLKEKKQRAQALIDSVQYRASSLARCTEKLIEQQADFFLRGKDLQPLTMSGFAEKCSLSVSGVSRIIKDKYLQFGVKVYPYKFFFSPESPQKGFSQQAVEERIAKLIHLEDPGHPMSDRELQETLAGEGITVARRTVAKYRTKKGIGPAFARRRARQ